MKPAMVEKKYQEAKSAYEFWSLARSVLERIPQECKTDDPSLVFYAYLYYGSLKDAAQFLRQRGIKYGSLVFQPQHISNIIRTQEIEDKELQHVARTLLEMGAQHMGRLYD